MQADTIKLWFSYGLATVIVVGGGLMLFASRNEANSDFALLMAGFIGGAIGFVFNRESATQATRAAQSSAASGAVTATASPPITHAEIDPEGGNG